MSWEDRKRKIIIVSCVEEDMRLFCEMLFTLGRVGRIDND